MITSSLDKYVEENNKEFNKEYANAYQTNEIFNHKSTQVLNTDCVPATATQSKSPQTKNVYSKKKTLYDFVKRYCYKVLTCGRCSKTYYQCNFKHNVSIFIRYFYFYFNIV